MYWENDMNHKQQNKNIRQPVGEESSVNKLSQEERVRMAMGRQSRLDASFYERLPEYQGKQLFWCNDLDGEVEKWLHLGAELVPRKTKSLKEFKGFTDNRSLSEWESVPGVGSDEGGRPITCYLMVMDAEDYHALRIAPKEARNQEILTALGVGKTEEKVMPNIKGLKTYAPNLPTGGKGFEQQHDV